MQLADYTFEDRLIERIAAREVLAKLSMRERRVLSRIYGQGDTYRDAGQCEGVSSNRIMQIHNKALRRLRHHASIPELATLPPATVTRKAPPPGFDKAEFLDHMRVLIRQRAEDEAAAFEREVYATRDLAKLAEPPPPRPLPSLEELARQAREITERTEHYNERMRQLNAERAAIEATRDRERQEAHALGWECVDPPASGSEAASLSHSRVFWTQIDPALGRETFYRVRPPATVTIKGQELLGGGCYLLPFSVMQALHTWKHFAVSVGSNDEGVGAWG